MGFGGGVGVWRRGGRCGLRRGSVVQALVSVALSEGRARYRGRRAFEREAQQLVCVPRVPRAALPAKLDADGLAERGPLVDAVFWRVEVGGFIVCYGCVVS